MDGDKIVYSGTLFVLPNGKLILKKSWQQKFCLLYKASKFGIERLEIFDSYIEAKQAQHVPNKIITLENCVKVTKKTCTTFMIITKTGTHEFSTINEKSLTEWISALQSVAFSDEASRVTTLEEDNDLYCSIGEGIFNVKLTETEASIRCKLTAKNYILVLTSTALQLREVFDNELLYTWPYQFIRRYGYSNGKFTFEAGRKCESGEGKFLLEHSNEKEIFSYLTMKMKHMKKLLKSDSVPNLDCGEKQLQAMLNMEARSRSPLPPSPTSATLQDLENLSMTVNELTEKFSKLNNPLSCSENNSKKSKQKINPIPPPKPPRKNMPSSKGDYEDIGKYDEIECRNNAWQTFGVTDIKHNENIADQNDLISWGKKSPILESDVPTAPKVITEIDSDYDSYDKLNFFGSSSKLNISGYKQVRANASIPPTPPSFNEYDEVHIMDCIRPADDSHLGYAVIRKKETQVDHKSFNDTEYAVISKPKRV